MPRSPKHFKLHCSIGNHRKTAGLASNNDSLAIYVRLGILAIDRFADRTGDTFIVNLKELPALTGTKRGDSARKLLNNLVETSPILVNYSATTCSITLPNFAKKQGFGSRNGVGMESPPTPAPAPAPAPAPIKESPVPGSDEPSAPPRMVASKEVWKEINEALKSYLPRATGLTLTASRRKRMAAVLKAHGRTSAVDAIHGYAAIHLTSAPEAGFNPLRNFNPDTCWRPALIGKYLDADRAAQDAGVERPYTAATREGKERDRFTRIMEGLTALERR